MLTVLATRRRRRPLVLRNRERHARRQPHATGAFAHSRGLNGRTSFDRRPPVREPQPPRGRHLLRGWHPRRHPDATLQGRAPSKSSPAPRSNSSATRSWPSRRSLHNSASKSILEGGVQRAGDRVRITVQLIDAATDAHIWAESYDRELTAANIFAIQSEVATAIAGAFRLADPGEQARVRRSRRRVSRPGRPTSSASSGWPRAPARRSPRPKGISGRRIGLDPKFALAWVGLADTLALQTEYAGRPKEPGSTRPSRR